MQHSALNIFFDSLNRFQVKIADLNQGQDRLMDEIKQIKQKIANSTKFQTANLSENSLKSKIDQLNQAIQRAFSDWEQELQGALPMKKLSDNFQDKIIFLIFGKVNAGKSSFCNQVIRSYEELFPNDSVNRFYIDKNTGEMKPHQGEFAEGFTETTVLIQGVELGKNFVLLDTPGLHSEQVQNGELTQRFLDSADAVLWLTPSTSPGQVQELNDLKMELEKGKPLLPVITRSDTVEEDWNDEAQDIISIYADKSSENRTLQEKDVKQRLSEFDGIKLNDVKDPISISTFTYKKHHNLQKSGLDRLFSQMAHLINEAANYKGEKADKQVKNFISEHVITHLNNIQNNNISPILQETDQVLSDLQYSKSSIENTVRLSVFNQLDNIISKHKDKRNKDGVIKDVSNIINQTLNQELSEKLSKFVKTIEQANAHIDSKGITGFEPLTVDREEITGSGWKGAGAAAGGAGGALIGSLFGPVGTVIGGMLGSYAGSKAGEFFVETRTVTEEIGLSTEKMENNLREELTQKIHQIIDKVIDETMKQIQPLKAVCDNLDSNIKQIKLSVEKI